MVGKEAVRDRQVLTLKFALDEAGDLRLGRALYEKLETLEQAFSFGEPWDTLTESSQALYVRAAQRVLSELISLSVVVPTTTS